jgi:ABC-type branched-subunit amino acid transport system ATPase component
MLEIAALRKRYGAVTAVDGVPLEAGRRKIAGPLCPNGARAD